MVKKIKRGIVFHDTGKLYKFKFQCLQMKFYWNTASFIHLSVILWCFQAGRLEPYLLSGPLQRILANLGSPRGVTPNLHHLVPNQISIQSSIAKRLPQSPSSHFFFPNTIIHSCCSIHEHYHF